MQIAVTRAKYGFKIVSLETAREFCEEILRPCEFDFRDADDHNKYHRISKDKAGKVMLGTAFYGQTALTAMPVVMDDRDIVRRVYAIRKSINRYLFQDISKPVKQGWAKRRIR